MATATASKVIVASVGAYAVGINALAAYLFQEDKRRAVKREWRISERTLQGTALAGGWLGGMWAMNRYHHKTKKERFAVWWSGVRVYCSFMMFSCEYASVS
jgi:uncharacterized membrane protein YsdA (DUF1294 family)